MKLYFTAMKDSHREKLQEQLTKLIMKVLVSNPQLHYYQVSGLSKIWYLFNRSKGHDSGYITAHRGMYWYLYCVYCWKPAQINSGMDTETVSPSNIKCQRAGNTPNILILANRLKSKLKSHISLQILPRPPCYLAENWMSSYKPRHTVISLLKEFGPWHIHFSTKSLIMVSVKGSVGLALI